ncbi:hypothetical protein ACOBR2_02920 [Telmatobacter bradus]|uniref:hypothetical protein n=1 Tax=Telmatobacter bradus TaxID=474953 RepID=UPI003B42E9AB
MIVKLQGLDYSSALDASVLLTIERKLNAPSICNFRLCLPDSSALSIPVRFQAVSVAGDDGTVYFTGYIAASPVPEYLGLGIEGPKYGYLVYAISDEILLDQYLLAACKNVTGLTVSAMLESLVNKSGSSALSTKLLTLDSQLGNVAFRLGTSWSQCAGQAAAMARATYRAVSGVLELSSIQSVVHELDESDGTLNMANLVFEAQEKRALANDVTVCGEHEPVAYVTEYFEGDGTTLDFYLSADPFSLSSSKEVVIDEDFNESVVNSSVWGNTGDEYLTIGAEGLSMNGGNGVDGQAVLKWLDPIEMGGTVVFEAAGVLLDAGSSGVLCGLYNGDVTVDGCVAGFQVTSATGTGTVSIQPILNGLAGGTSYTLSSSNQYALRLRVHCPEFYRAEQIYRSSGDDGAISVGGTWTLSPASVTLEVQEYVNSVGATPVTLYDGAFTNFPGVCYAVAASSINLIGSMSSIELKNIGSAWVVSTPSSGGAYTRRLGTTAESAECHVERTGELVFYSGYAPASGEHVAVSYRTIGRAVGRAVNTSSQTALAAAGYPSESAWIGTVTTPAARTSADCRNAALVIEQAAASVSALWSGRFKGTNFCFASDVWPGDALELVASSLSLDVQVVVRSVKITYQSSMPDLIEYTVAFANDWADDLAVKTSTTVPDDTWLPAVVSPTLLSNLNALTVTMLSSTTVTINTGVTPVTGGGFEIRRRDFVFRAGEDTDLVTRTSAQNITFARESANDRFYIRMYDASTPPNYSEFSTALLINLPFSS